MIDYDKLAKCGNPDPERNCRYAEVAADFAVQKVFAILGVNVHEPKEVREFQQDLRFGSVVRKVVDKGLLAVAAAIAVAAVAALWVGITSQIRGGS